MNNQKSNKKDLLYLNRFLAKWGGLSRRKAERLIKQKTVFVNNYRISDPTYCINPYKDTVRINKQVVKMVQEKKKYVLFNKPKKVLSMTEDSKGRPTVMDYVKKYKKQRLFSVGHLNWESEGLLLLTNDGNFANQVFYSKVPKTYLVKVQGRPKISQINKLSQGVSTPLGKKKVLFVKRIPKKTVSTCWIKIILHEERKHQIRSLFDKIGFPVVIIKRVAIGRLKMNKLRVGFSIPISEKDKEKVFQIPKELDFLKFKKPSNLE